MKNLPRAERGKHWQAARGGCRDNTEGTLWGSALGAVWLDNFSQLALEALASEAHPKATLAKLAREAKRILAEQDVAAAA